MPTMQGTAPIQLSSDEREYVQVFVQRGKANVRALTRARVLLKSDDGWTNAEMVEALDISDQTIRNSKQRFVAGGVQAVLTDKQQERRRQALSDEQAAHLMGMSTGPCVCSQAKPLHGDTSEGSRRKPYANGSKNGAETLATRALVHSQR